MLTETNPEPVLAALSKCFDKLSDTKPGSDEWTKLMAEIVALQEKLENA